jgi:asparagine synthase (glutamine-hydrolysing)
MSGGLDSTSVAAIGARELRRRGEDRPMRAISWVFDELDACDERPFIDAVVSRSGIEAWWVRGDDAWPLANSSFLARNPGTPEQNAYRELKERAHLKASAVGSRVALSGASADLYSSGTEPWLWDLLRRGRVAEAATSLAVDIRQRNLRHALRRAGFGAFLRPLRALMASPVPNAPWLTEWAARSVTAEIYDANLAGIDLRHPYRDRRLTEFMLSVPAHQLYRHGRFKHLAREAAAGLLPPEIPARTEPTLLTPLFRRGIFERERAAVRRLLLTSESAWDRYVDRNWVVEILQVGPQRPHDEIVLWQCVSFESWLRRHRWGAEARQFGDWSVSLTESAA